LTIAIIPGYIYNPDNVGQAMATQDASASGDHDGSGVSGDGISQSTYVFVYILSMVVSAWIFVAYW